MRRFSSPAAALLVFAGTMSAGVAFGTPQTKSAPGQAAPPRLSYTAVHDPQFVPAAQATWVADEDRVIGLMSGTTAKAYPASILAQHGLVEDQSPSGPIAITW